MSGNNWPPLIIDDPSVVQGHDVGRWFDETVKSRGDCATKPIIVRARLYHADEKGVVIDCQRERKNDAVDDLSITVTVPDQ